MAAPAQNIVQLHDTVDLNRGVTMRRGSDDAWVCMYKDTPGQYFTVRGIEVTPEVAGKAGFEVAEQMAEGLIQKRVQALETKMRSVKEEGVASLLERMQKMTPEEILGMNDFADHEDEKVYRVDSEFVTLRTATDEPRGTRFHTMQHRGGGNWAVVKADTEEIVLADIDKEAAVDFIIREAERTATE